MQGLRAAIALGLGLSLTILSLAMLAPSPAPVLQALAAAAAHGAEADARTAQVAIAFDRKGHPLAHALRRSSGSPTSDAAAVREALELASLREPRELAGKTVLFTASFDESPQLD
jgi:hypothetical protein